MAHNFKGLILGLTMLVLFSACSSNVNQDLPRAIPQQASQQSEIALARLGQLLGSDEYDQQQKAEFLFERGLLFDQLGLRTLASFDFNRALHLKPDYAEAYNFLGVYALLAQEFDQSYESFDSAIELAPDYDFSYFYRSVALYYGGREQLAYNDIEDYASRDENDPYRVLWRYIIGLSIDETAAKQRLKLSYDSYGSQEWGWQIVNYYLGGVNEAQLQGLAVDYARNNRMLADNYTEAYFYIAKQYQHEGKHPQAQDFFKQALANNIYEFIEHRFALLELSRY